MGIEAAHLGDAAGVIGDGAVGVDGDGDAGGGEHADGGEGDAVEVAGDGIGYIDADADEDDGHPCAHHADGDAADDGGGGAGLGLARDALDGCIVLGGIDLGDEADGHAADDAGDDGPEELHPAVTLLAEEEGRDDHQGRGQIGAGVEDLVRIAVFDALDHHHAEDGGHDAAGHQEEGQADALGVPGSQEQSGEDRAHIGFEQVRAHAGHVAHVVAHVVADDGGVAGVILGDAGLHLAHQVGAHVSGLGIDAAAHTGKQSDGGSAQGEAGDDIVVPPEDQIEDGQPQRAQTDHAQPQHRAAGKGDVQRGGHALFGALGGADVGAGGAHHAAEARQDREQSTHKEADGRGQVQHDEQDHEHDGGKDSHHHILALEVSHGALVDEARDLTHPGVLHLDGGIFAVEGKGHDQAQRRSRDDEISVHTMLQLPFLG